jgi:predicted nucleic acid-binding protein
VGISVVSYLEFLAFPALSESDAVRFQEFCVQVAVVGLQFEDRQLCQEVTRLRREHRLRLPDAIIAAAALVRGALLVTADGHFDRVAELQQLRFV